MLKKEYNVIISTPMGNVDGKVMLNISGSDLSGTIFFMRSENEFTGGTIDEAGNVSFKGNLKMPVGKMAYMVTGRFTDRQIDAVAKTKIGDFVIKDK